MTEEILSEIEKLLDYKASSSDGDITFVETDMTKIQEQLINLYTTYPTINMSNIKIISLNGLLDISLIYPCMLVQNPLKFNENTSI